MNYYQKSNNEPSNLVQNVSKFFLANLLTIEWLLQSKDRCAALQLPLRSQYED